MLRRTHTLPLLAAALGCATLASAVLAPAARAQDANADNGVDLLSGYLRLWTPGQSWNTGTPTPLGQALLPLNLGEVAVTALTRTHDTEVAAYYDDRRNQSYSVIDGLGPLTAAYLAGSGAVTTIPVFDATTRTTSYTDSGTGAGVSTAPFGVVAQLVTAVRANASTTPAKTFFSYPRPWRQDLFGYSLAFVVAPSLVPEESPTPATDGGFPSGHTNAAFLTAFAMAYAVPERFQELLVRASELGSHRIVAGMHSPLDVIGGRDLATFKSIEALSAPANATLKAQARSTALAAFATQCPTTAAGCAHPTTDAFTAVAHPDAAARALILADAARDSIPARCANTLGVCAGSLLPPADRFADRATNETVWSWRLQYGFPAVDPTDRPATVPANAEVLLETRLPYLTPDQRREVLRTTAIASGSPLLDDPAGYGRLDLFHAADGYRRFDATVSVTMNGASGGFSALDAWRNDIDGSGGLVKAGSGTLVLAGRNSFTGDVAVTGGILATIEQDGLGRGDVSVSGGTLQVAAASGVATIRRDLAVGSNGALLLGGGHATGVPSLVVRGTARLSGTLQVAVPANWTAHGLVPLVTAGHRVGRFSAVQVTGLPRTGTARVVYVGDAVLLQVSA